MNVDKATRILNHICTDDFQNLSADEKNQKIYEFICLPENEKPKAYRGVSEKNMCSFLNNLNTNLKTAIKTSIDVSPNFTIKSTSNNNVDFADLYLIDKGKRFNIEIKFGAETLAQIGNDRMNTVFCLANSQKYNFLTLASTIQKEQRNYVDTHTNATEQGVLKNLKQLLIKELPKLNLTEQTLDNEQILKFISNNGNYDVNNFNLLKLRIDYNKPITMIYTFKQNTKTKWNLKSAFVSKDSSRIEIRVENKNNEIKFLLNWKNNKKYKNKIYSAKWGLGTANWNIWIYNKQEIIDEPKQEVLKSR